jgi:hypothetical protein
MPNGSTYESAEMEPLKPNERAILSVAFSAADAASHTFQADVDTVGDRNALNDRFVETVSLD